MSDSKLLHMISRIEYLGRKNAPVCFGLGHLVAHLPQARMTFMRVGSFIAMAACAVAWCLPSTFRLSNPKEENAMARATTEFNGFIGQRSQIRAIKAIAGGTKALLKEFCDTLITGESGLGKTTLARAIAREMGTEFYEICMNPKFKPNDLAKITPKLKPGDVLFCDEIQSASYESQESLCRMMTERKAPVLIDIAPGFTAIIEKEIPPITLICATDRPGKLLKALKSRFQHTVELSPYTFRDMKDVIRIRASEKKMLLTPQARHLIARTSHGSPRISGNRLDLMKVIFAKEPPAEFTAQHVRRFLTTIGLDRVGLNTRAREYLKYLNKYPAEGVVLNALVTLLGVDAGYVQRDIETVLTRLGFVKINKMRFITDAGIKHLEDGYVHVKS